MTLLKYSHYKGIIIIIITIAYNIIGNIRSDDIFKKVPSIYPEAIFIPPHHSSIKISRKYLAFSKFKVRIMITI